MIPWQKYAAESDTFMVDFVDDLGGDTIASVVTLTATGGVALGAPVIYPTYVKFRVSGGTSGGQETVTCIVMTAGGDTLEAVPLLDVL